MTVGLDIASKIVSGVFCVIEEFTEAELLAFFEYLKADEAIMTLSFWRRNITLAVASALSEAVIVNRTLKTLVIPLDYISTRCATILFNALKINKSITKLVFSHSYMSLDLLDPLVECLKWNTTIKTLELNQCVFEKGGFGRLAEILMVNNTLEQLHLGGVMCNVVGARALAESLTVNSSLRMLDLSNNQLGDAGVTVLAERLKENRGLKYLVLSHNKIGSNGVVALAGLIKADTPIETLIIYSNNYSSYNCKTLVKARKKNISLLDLYMDVCDQSDYGFRTGFQALPSSALLLSKNTLDSNDYFMRNRICCYFNIELAHAVTVVYALNINDNIKTCVLKYKSEIESRLKTLEFEKLYFDDNVCNLFGSFMLSVFHWVHAETKDLTSAFNTVVDDMSAVMKAADVQFTNLPEHFFAKEFIRFMTGCIEAMNAKEVESQANALLCFLHPFKNKSLQSRAVVELFGMVDEELITKLFKHQDEKRALDILLLSLCKHCENHREIFLLGLAACARLEGLDAPDMQTSIDMLNNTSYETLADKFENTLRTLAQNENLPLNNFLKNHHEKIINILSNTHTPPAPNPRATHSLFPPATSPELTAGYFEFSKLNQ